MGGHALRSTQTARKSRAEYEEIEERVLAVLRSAGFHCAVPRVFPGKESFGDLDVLFIPLQETDTRAFVEAHFRPTEIVQNGAVMSFNATAVPHAANFQIDLIEAASVADPTMAMDVFYFSYGDLGGLLGILANSIGIKLGEVGLFIKMPQDSRKVVLSDSPGPICEFLGLSYEAWKAGFKTHLEAYEWICTSRFFKADFFRALNRNHRDRAAARPMYSGFIAFVCRGDEGEKGEIQEAIVEAAGPKGELKESHRDEAIAYFGMEHEIEAHEEARAKFVARRDKFNGKILMALGVGERRVGSAMDRFKKHVAEEEEFEVWLDARDAKAVQEEIRLWLKAGESGFLMRTEDEGKCV